MFDRAFLLRAATGMARRINYPTAKALESIQKRKNDEARRRAQDQKLSHLESLYGKLDAVTRNRIREYSLATLGSDSYFHELAIFTVLAREFREGWIPTTYRWKFIVPRETGDYWKISEAKSLFLRMVPAAETPDIGYFCNGAFLSKDLAVIPAEETKAALFADQEKIVLKLDSTVGGRGVHVLNERDFDPTQIKNLGNGVFQRFVEQHEDLAALSPGPVGTLRVVTARGPLGQPTVRAAYLGMGRQGQGFNNNIDNIRCAVDTSTGALSEVAYSRDWTTTKAHPDTGNVFLGRSFPEFANCVELCLKMHRSVPQIRSVGWDVTVEKNGTPVALEWNVGHGTGFPEPIQGPCFADLGWEALWRLHMAA